MNWLLRGYVLALENVFVTGMPDEVDPSRENRIGDESVVFFRLQL